MERGRERENEKEGGRQGRGERETNDAQGHVPPVDVVKRKLRSGKRQSRKLVSVGR